MILQKWSSYADGFAPEAYYESKPLLLPAATLGRIFWDEEKIGDPTKLMLQLESRPDWNSEPQVMFRVNEFESRAEWKDEGAIVIDRRPGSRTLGQEVDLNDPQTILKHEKFLVRCCLKSAKVFVLPEKNISRFPGNLRRQVEPDLEFWSGFKKLTTES